MEVGREPDVLAERVEHGAILPAREREGASDRLRRYRALDVESKGDLKEPARRRLGPRPGEGDAKRGQRMTALADDFNDVRRHAAGESDRRVLHRREACLA